MSNQQIPYWEAAKSLSSHSWNQEPRISDLHAADICMLSSNSHTKRGAPHTLQCNVNEMGKAQFEPLAHKQDGSMPDPGSNNHQPPQQHGCTANGGSNAHATMSQHSHCVVVGSRRSPFQHPPSQNKCSVSDMPLPCDQQLPQQNSSSTISRPQIYTHQPAMKGNSNTLFGSQIAGEPSNQKYDMLMRNSSISSHSQGASRLSKQNIRTMMHSSDFQSSAYKQHTCTVPGRSNTQFDSRPARQLSNDSSAQTYMRQSSYGSDHTISQGCKMGFAPQQGSPKSPTLLHAEEGVYSPPANQRDQVQLALQWNPQPNSHLSDMTSPELGNLLQMGQEFLPDVHPLEYDALI